MKPKFPLAILFDFVIMQQRIKQKLLNPASDKRIGRNQGKATHQPARKPDLINRRQE